MKKRSQPKNRATAFARDMIAVLNNKRELDWRVDKAEGGTREAVDVVGWRNGNRRVLVEVELRRHAPLANVVKVWKQLTNKRPSKRLVMFQAFSAWYPKDGTQRGNAEFVAREMEKACPIKYIPLAMNDRPGKGYAGKPVVIGAGARRHHAQRLANRILARLDKMGFNEECDERSQSRDERRRKSLRDLRNLDPKVDSMGGIAHRRANGNCKNQSGSPLSMVTLRNGTISEFAPPPF